MNTKRGRPRKETASSLIARKLKNACFYDARRELIVCEWPEFNYSFVSAVDALNSGVEIPKLGVWHG